MERKKRKKTYREGRNDETVEGRTTRQVYRNQTNWGGEEGGGTRGRAPESLLSHIEWTDSCADETGGYVDVGAMMMSRGG